MDSFGKSGMLMPYFASQITSIAMWMFLLSIVAMSAMYFIARRRDAGQDPQLGLKLILHIFATTAFQLTLSGLTLALFTALSSSDGDEKSSLYRFAFGTLLPGIIVLGAHVLLLRRTNQHQFPTIHRLFIGYNVVTTGFIAFGALLLLGQALCGKGSSGDFGKASLSMVLIYGLSWLALGWRFVVLTTNAAPPTTSKSIDLRVSI